MADPFEADLPDIGQAPWNLNPAVEEVRYRIGSVEDIAPGSSFETKLSAAIDEGRSSNNVKMYGAVGDASDSTGVFATMLTEAKNARRSGAPSSMSDGAGTYVIELPPGDFTIKQLNGLLGVEAPTAKTVGLKIKGAGSTLTNIIFDPGVTGQALCFNDYWLGLRFEGIRFVAKQADSTFMRSYTTHSAQDYTFIDVAWQGWKYGIDLQGNNNNSEFRFFGCATSKTQKDGAFLYIGATNTSDQFLNYWFYGFKHWSTSAPIIDAAKGGHFHFYGLDVSDWGAELTAPGYIFNLRGHTHSFGVQGFTANGMRVEAKSAFAGLLFSEWADGNVSIECDWSSQVNAFTYGDIIFISLENVPGVMYHFHDSHLAGGVKVKYAVNAWQAQHSIVFSNTVWRQRLTPSEVVTWDESAAGSLVLRPMVRFENCRGTTQNAYNTAGSSVWDAAVGDGDMVHKREKRSIVLKEGARSPASSAIYAALPVGAIITGLKALGPAGAVTEADGGTWTLSTTEATPTQIAQVVVTTALSAGFAQAQELAVPFLCSSREKATVKVTPTGVTQGSRSILILVEGYW